MKSDSLHTDRLRTNIYNGHVCLEKLELNNSCLDFLCLPLCLEKGYIGQIEFKISGGNWSNLVNSARIEVVVDNIFLYVRPKYDWTKKENERRDAYIKEAKLRRAEMFAINRHNSDLAAAENATDDGGGGFFARLGTRLVDNIELLIRNVHVRYQDSVSRPARPFAFGFVLDSLRMNSTDESWGDAYVNRASRLIAAIHKRIRLSQFAIYCNPVADDNMFTGMTAEAIKKCSYEDWEELFQPRSRFGGKSAPRRMHHILRPVDAQVFLKLADDTFDTSGEPHVCATIQVNNISLVIEESAYHNILYLVSSIEGFTKRSRYEHLRSPRRRPTEAPLAWWKYAVEAVLMDRRERAKTYTPAFVAERRRDRLKYMKYWQRKCVGSELVTSGMEETGGIFFTLSRNGKKRMKELEQKLKVEDVLFFRSLADAELERTRGAREQRYRQLAEERASSGGGVLGYLFGVGGGGVGSGQYTSASVPALSATERAKVFDDLGYDPTRGISKYDFPADFVYQKIEFEIGELTLEVVSTEIVGESFEDSVYQDYSTVDIEQSMRSSGSSAAGALSGSDGMLTQRGQPREVSERVFQASMTGLSIALKQRVESQRVEVQLVSIKAVDPQTHPSRIEYRLIQLRDYDALSEEGGAEKSLFLNFVYDINPPSADVDGSLAMRMQPLEIVYSATSWNRMLDCFNVPVEMDTWEQLEMAAMKRIESIEANAQAKFEYAMSNHFRFDMNLKVSAPVIIVPENKLTHYDYKKDVPWEFAEGNSHVLVCDLGQMTFASTDVSRNEDTEADENNNDEFYDHYQMRMADMQIFLLKSLHFHSSSGSNKGDAVLRQSYDGSKAEQLVDKFGCTINLQTSILPFDRTITRIKIWSLLPSLRIKITTLSFKALVELAQSYETDQGWSEDNDTFNEELDTPRIQRQSKDEKSFLARARRLSHSMHLGKQKGTKVQSNTLQRRSNLTKTEKKRLRLKEKKKRLGKKVSDRGGGRGSRTTGKGGMDVNWRLIEASLLVMDARLDVLSSKALLTYPLSRQRARPSMEEATHIVRLQLNNLSISTAVRTFSTELRLSLYGLQLEDVLRRRSASAPTKYLLKSFAEEDRSGARKLVAITYILTLPIPSVPQHSTFRTTDDSEGQGSETNISLVFDHLMMRCQQRTLAALISVFLPNVSRKQSRRKSSQGSSAAKSIGHRSIFLSPTTPAGGIYGKSAKKRMYSSGVESSPGRSSVTLGQYSSNEEDLLSYRRRQRKELRASATQPSSNLDATGSRTNITVSLEGIEVFFDDENRRLGCITLGHSSLDLDLSEHVKQSMLLKGKLGNLSLVDLTRIQHERVVSASDHSVEIFGLRKDTSTSLVTFDVSKDVDDGMDVVLKMTSVKFVALTPFIVEMETYFCDGALARIASSMSTPSRQSSYSMKQKKKNEKLNFDVELDCPLVVVPRAASSPDMVIIDLGKICVRNTFFDNDDEESQVIFAKFSETHVRCGSEKIMDDHSASIKVTIGGSKNQEFEIDVSLTAIHVGISQDHLSLIVGIWFDNLISLHSSSKDTVEFRKSSFSSAPSPSVTTTPQRKLSSISSLGGSPCVHPEGEFLLGDSLDSENVPPEFDLGLAASSLSVKVHFKAIELELLDAKGSSKRSQFTDASMTFATSQQMPSFRTSVVGPSSIARFTIAEMLYKMEELKSGIVSTRTSTVSLESIKLQDSREYSSNAFRDIIAPVTSLQKSLEIHAEEDLNANTIDVVIDIPAQYRFILVPSTIHAVTEYVTTTLADTVAAATILSSGRSRSNNSTAPTMRVDASNGIPQTSTDEAGYLPHANSHKDSLGLLTMAANDDTQPVLTSATKKVTITLKKFNPEVWLLEDASQKRCLAVIITLHASFTTIMTTSSETTTLRSANFKAEECAILTRQAGVRETDTEESKERVIHVVAPFAVEVGLEMPVLVLQKSPVDADVEKYYSSSADEDENSCTNSKEELVSRVSLSPIIATIGYHDFKLASVIASTWTSHTTSNKHDDNDDTIASRSDAFSDSDYGSGSKTSNTIYSQSVYSSRVAGWDERSSSLGYDSRVAASTVVTNDIHDSGRSSEREPNSNGGEFPLGKLTVLSSTLKITLTNDLHGQNTPLAEVMLNSMSADIHSTEEVVTANLSLEFGADYHNLKLMTWEPLMEPWVASFDVTVPLQSHKPDDEQHEKAFLDDLNVSIIARSERICNVNVTEAMLENVASLEQGIRWITNTDQKELATSGNRSEFSLYHVINHTGMSLMYWTEDGTARVLENGEETPLHFVGFSKHSSEQREDNSKSNRFLMINILDGDDVTETIPVDDTRSSERRGSMPNLPKPCVFLPQRVRIDALGTQLYDLSYSNKEDQGNDRSAPVSSVCAHVVCRNGSKVVYLQSGMVVRNETKQIFKIKWTSQGSSKKEEGWEMSLQPGQVAQLPASLPLNQANVILQPLHKSAYSSDISSISSSVSRAIGNGGIAAWPMSFVKQEDIAQGILELQVRACMRVDSAAEELLGINSRDTGKRNIRRYLRLLSIRPSVILQNCTPQKLRYEFSLLETHKEGSFSSGKIVEWEGVAIPNNTTAENCLSIRVCLPGCDWSESIQLVSTEQITADSPCVISAKAFDRKSRTMFIQVEIKRAPEGTFHVSVYLPYWINNLTGLPLIFCHKSADRPGQLVACQAEERSVDDGDLVDVDESESQALFLGTGPRKLGLRELLPGKNGELVPALLEARAVGMVERRIGRTQKTAKEEWNARSESLILMDFSNLETRTSRVSVRLARGMNSTHASSTFNTLLPTEWSIPFALDSAGTTGEIEIPEEKNVSNILMYRERAAYSLGVSIGLGHGPFSHTRVVTIAPRFLVVNHTGRPLLVKQEGAGADRYVASGSNERALLVRSDSQCPFHWASSRASQRLMTVRFDEYGWEFSSGFEIMHVGSFSLNMRNPHTQKHYIARVVVEQQGPTLVVTFNAELPRTPPYRIENTSFETLRFHQDGVDGVDVVLLPYKSAKYTWDDLSGSRLLVLEALGGSSEPHPPVKLGTFSMDKIDDYTNLPGSLPLRVSILPDGPTKVLRIVDSRVEQVAAEIDGRRSSKGHRWSTTSRRRSTRQAAYSKQKQSRSYSRGRRGSLKTTDKLMSPPRWPKSNRTSSLASMKPPSPPRRRRTPPSDSSKLEVRKNRVVYSFSLSLDFKGFGISFIDITPRELLYCHIDRVQFFFTQDTNYVRVNASIKDLQIDNQLYSTRYPVLLFTGRDLKNREERHAAFSCGLVSKRTAEVTFVESLSLGITPVDLNIDGDLLIGMYNWYKRGINTIGGAWRPATGASDSTVIAASLASYESHAPVLEGSGSKLSTKQGRKKQDISNTRTYFQLFKIDQLDVHISFSSGSVGAASSLLRTMGASLTRIENAPLRLNGILLRHAYETSNTLIDSIIAQYRFDALRQAYVILGSSELLGNPITLFKHLGTGVRDFFYEPVMGLFQFSPFGIVQGLRTGTISLLQNTVVGVSMFMGKFVGSLARMAPSLFGLNKALRIVEHFFITVGGSVGALETEKKRMIRVRPPRVFADPQLKVYDREAEEGDEILSRVSNGMYWGEGYNNHCELDNGTILVLTFERAMVVSRHYDLVWEVLLSEILDVTVREGTVIITFYPRSVGFVVMEQTLPGNARAAFDALKLAVKARGYTLRVM